VARKPKASMHTSIFELAMFSKMQENASDYNFHPRNAWVIRLDIITSKMHCRINQDWQNILYVVRHHMFVLKNSNQIFQSLDGNFTYQTQFSRACLQIFKKCWAQSSMQVFSSLGFQTLNKVQSF